LLALANINEFPACELRRKRAPLVRSDSGIDPVSAVHSDDG
jgi:hypothetical protein